MSCAGCKKRHTLDNIINLAKVIVNIEKQSYAVIEKGDIYDFIKLDEAIRTKKRIIKILQVN